MLVKTDLIKYVEESDLDQLTGSDDAIVDEVILDAEEVAREYLRPRYDIDFELSQVDPDRNRSLLKHLTAIAIFFLFERIPTNTQPEARFEAYERGVQWLKDVAKGMVDTKMKEYDSPENEKGYSIRWGSNPKSKAFKY
jgi:phage gp36-like protein